MTATVAPRRTQRHNRDRQRFAHLLAAVVLLAYIYVGPSLGAGVTAAVQWVVVPVLVVSGVAMWKWARIRAMLRGRR